jgi:hypothetical protein
MYPPKCEYFVIIVQFILKNNKNNRTSQPELLDFNLTFKFRICPPVCHNPS